MLHEPLDTKGRVKRWTQRPPQGKRIQLDPNKHPKFFYKFHVHGPLPTKHAFAHYGTENKVKFQQLMRRYIDGAELNGPYLIRPTEYRSADLYYEDCVYDLHQNAVNLLKDEGLYHAVQERRDHADHRLMGSCITSSIDLAANFIPRHSITKNITVSLGKKEYEPDEVFGIETNEKVFFYAAEWDKSTEQFSKSHKKRETIVDKLEAQDYIVQNKLWKQWGITNIGFLWGVVSAGRGNNIISEIKQNYPRLLKRSYFKVFRDFSPDYRRIPDVYKDILKGWERADGVTVDISNL